MEGLFIWIYFNVQALLLAFSAYLNGLLKADYWLLVQVCDASNDAI